MRYIITIVLAILVGWGGAGCDSADQADPPAAATEAADTPAQTEPADATPLTLTADDDGSTHTITVGETVTIDLAGNPTTGYEWSVASIDGDAVSLEGEDYSRPSGERRMGGVGTYRWTFLAKHPGQTIVRLVYSRDWEDAEPKRTFTVTLTVEP